MAEVRDGEIDGLLAETETETEVFRWKVAVARGEGVEVLVVVDAVQRGPPAAAIKTLPVPAAV